MVAFLLGWLKSGNRMVAWNGKGMENGADTETLQKINGRRSSGVSQYPPLLIHVAVKRY